MKIKQRNNGDWCMEHNGVEAPYNVVFHSPGIFSVIELDDEENEQPVALIKDQETCERLATEHFNLN